MGYTHYWSGEATLDAKTTKDVRAIVRTAKDHGIKVCNGVGTGRPTISTAEITLNGSAEDDADYETFSVGKSGAWNFCKTARRPYDAVVGAILLRLISDTFKVASDGNYFDPDDWGAAKDLFERALPGRSLPGRLNG